MFAQIRLESVAGPTALDFDDFEGDPPQEIFECRTYPDPVALYSVVTRCLSCIFKGFNEGGFC